VNRYTWPATVLLCVIVLAAGGLGAALIFRPATQTRTVTHIVTRIRTVTGPAKVVTRTRTVTVQEQDPAMQECAEALWAVERYNAQWTETYGNGSTELEPIAANNYNPPSITVCPSSITGG
jgi:hypothetical protein